MKELKRVATENLIKRERNKAAKYFLMARKTPDPTKKEELLLSSYDTLKALIDQFPSSPMIEKLNDELQGIESLLSRIDHEEEFGICEECGEHIPHKRLLAVPEARLCINCQQELEESEHGLPSASGKSFPYRW